MLPHLIAVVIFFIISIIYFSPVLEGKKIRQSDHLNYLGYANETNTYAEEMGRPPLWTNALFGGMPTYFITHTPKSNLLAHLNTALSLFGLRTVNLIFLYLLGFYLCLIAFGIKPWISIMGAIAYAFSSYFFIIIEPGHITKAIALGYMPAIIGGIYLAFNKKLFLGALMMSLFLALQIFINHLQITYYTAIILLLFGLFQFYFSIKEKQIMKFFKTVGVLIFGVIIAISCNITNIWTAWEYGQYSSRGKSELTNDKDNKTSGLDKDYATAWSYGVSETLNLFIPNLFGGSSMTDVGKDSETYAFFEKNYGRETAKQASSSIPTYWGPQPFTSGPVYLGASVLFLFLMGLFLLKGHLKWWLLTATIIAIMLAWGKHFMFLTDFFLDYVPGYNKFRVVSMILVIVQFTVPLLGILFFDKLLKKEYDWNKIKKALIKSLSILGGLALFFLVFGSGFFDFTSPEDIRLKEAGYPVDAIVNDRISMLQSDAFRSLVFVILMAGLIFFVVKKNLKTQYAIIIASVLILADLWSVDKRYVNNDNFVSKREFNESIKKTSADEAILQDKSLYYRVYNASVNTFNDASTSYYHKSIGGYSGVKMKRYQELIEHQISKNNMSVLNMLNTKYFIIPTKEGAPMPQMNPEALGNAWFVDTFKLVANADSELNALSNFNPAHEAIIDKRFEKLVANFKPSPDSLATISLTKYHPENLEYESNASIPQLAVFSDIYYDKGWNAFIDGKPAPHFRTNYVLRAMIIPEGKHQITFKFEPVSYWTGEKISFYGSLLLIILTLAVIFYEFRKSQKKAITE